MSKLRIGMIGCGRIAKFHVAAMAEAGLEITAVSGSPGSTTVADFAKKYEIPVACGDPAALLALNSELDGVLICTSVSPTLDLLRRSLDANLPVLVEKPVAYNSESLETFIGSSDSILVGYNRRFYQSTIRARNDLSEKSDVLGQLVLPEGIRIPENDSGDQTYLRPFFANSVHGLDMARSVLGDLSLQHVERMYNDGGALTGLAAILVADSGALLQFTANFGAPANFALTLDQAGRRYDLKPFETATVYEGMDVVDPTPAMPLRQYLPRPVENIDPLPEDLKFKPGFVAQSRAFAALITGDDTGHAARIEDAQTVLRLAEELAGTTLPNS
jgi:predicted dehydrogenase